MGTFSDTAQLVCTCCAVVGSGADVLALTSDRYMPYDLCEDDDTLEVIESAMAEQGTTTLMYSIVDSGVTNLIHDRRSYVDFTLEVEANVARCVHSSVNKPGMKRNSGL